MTAVLAGLAGGLPPLRGAQLAANQFDAVPVALILAAGALYLWGVHRVNRLQPRHPWPGGRTAAFVGGLATVALAIFSAVGVYDRELFWVHMVQHLALIMVAASLFAVSSPIDLAFRASTGATHQRVTRALRSPVARFLGHPAVAFILYAVVVPVTHLTSLYNDTLDNVQIHNLEHLLFLGIGYLFWRQIFGHDPNRYRLHPALQMGLLFLAVPIDTFTGLSLDSTRHEIFPAYLTLHRTWGVSAVTDLHLGGIIMWVGGDTLMMLPLIPLALRWMHLEQRRAVRVDRELDAMFPEDRGLPGDPDHRTGAPPPPGGSPAGGSARGRGQFGSTGAVAPT